MYLIIWRINSLAQASVCPFFEGEAGLPECRDWNDWFIQKAHADADFKALFYEERKRRPDERRDHTRRQHFSCYILFDIPDSLKALTYIVAWDNRDEDLYIDSANDYYYLYLLMCLVYLWKATESVSLQTIVSRGLQMKNLSAHPKELLEWANSGWKEQSFEELLQSIKEKDPAVDCEMEFFACKKQYQKQVDDLTNRIKFLENLHPYEIKFASFKEEEKGYYQRKEAYRQTLGECIKVFSYCREVCAAEKELFLYNDNAIVIYGKLYNLKQLVGSEKESDTAILLTFNKQGVKSPVSIECYSPENLAEFMSYLPD